LALKGPLQSAQGVSLGNTVATVFAALTRPFIRGGMRAGSDSRAPLVGVLSVVATRLLGMKLLARSRPEERVPEDVMGPYGLRIIRSRKKQVRTWRDLIRGIAGMGGFQGRKSDGEPGWITIWRGFLQLWTGIETAHALLHPEKCGE